MPQVQGTLGGLQFCSRVHVIYVESITLWKKEYNHPTEPRVPQMYIFITDTGAKNECIMRSLDNIDISTRLCPLSTENWNVYSEKKYEHALTNYFSIF